jgi:hypothetical protein
VPYADVNPARLPDAVGFVGAASIGCRFMTSFDGIVDQARVRPVRLLRSHGILSSRRSSGWAAPTVF